MGTVLPFPSAARGGPASQIGFSRGELNRIVDLYTPDFFDICGCPGWSGTTTVTISVY